MADYKMPLYNLLTPSNEELKFLLCILISVWVMEFVC